MGSLFLYTCVNVCKEANLFSTVESTSLFLSHLVQLLLVLRATEQEIQQRSKAAESGWSAMTVADLQTTSEGQHCYIHVAHFMIFELAVCGCKYCTLYVGSIHVYM